MKRESHEKGVSRNREREREGEGGRERVKEKIIQSFY